MQIKEDYILIDPSKLPEKSLITIIAVSCAILSALYVVSYTRNQPFTFNGKEFGFGSDALQKKGAELEDSKKRLDEIQHALALARSENLQLKEENAKYVLLQQEQDKNNSALWFPVDDVQFLNDGSFSSLEGGNGTAKWSHKESEISLKLIDLTDGIVILGTNLPPPGNKIRIPTGNAILVHTEKWDYRLLTKEIHFDRATVQVERRIKGS
jgi:hypothetical protein